jgi:hypothetical protein
MRRDESGIATNVPDPASRRGGSAPILHWVGALVITAACVSPVERLRELPREGALHEWAQRAIEQTWDASLYPERLDRRILIGALNALEARIDSVRFEEGAPASRTGTLSLGAERVRIRFPEPLDASRFVQVLGDALLWVSDRLQAQLGAPQAWLDLEGIAISGALAALDPESSLGSSPGEEAVSGESPAAETVGTRKLERGIGYVRIVEVSPTTFDEFHRKLVDLGPISGLVIDLRGNRGGSMRVAAQIADLFLESGTIWRVVDRAARQGEAEPNGERLAALPSAADVPVPVAILVDRATAAAAEVIAGALAPAESVTLMGEQTAGKGLLQRAMPLPGGRLLNLTVAEFRLSNDRIVDGVGLVPELALPAARPPAASPRDLLPEADDELAIELARVLLSEGREAALRRL